MDIPQVSFAHGEISPIAAARTDAQFYSSAVQLLQNFFARAEGGISNRPGLQYIGQCLSNTPRGSVLVPFIYNNQQTYVGDFAAGSMQLFSNGVFVQNSSAATVTNVQAFFNSLLGETQVVYTCANSFLANQVVTVTGVTGTGTLTPNGTFTLAAASPTAFTVNVPGNVFFTYASGGTVSAPLQLTNPYALADLPNLRWAQSADTLNVTVGTQPLYQLKRLGPTSFTFTAPTLLFGPLQDVNTDGSTYVYVSGTQGTVTITASAPIFKPAHVGALFGVQEQFLGSIAEWEAQKLFNSISSAASPVGMYIRSAGKIYQCVAANASTTGTGTGQFQPVHTQGTQTDGNGASIPNLMGVSGVSWQFVSTNMGVAQITQYVDSQHVKAVVQSFKGVYSNFPPTVVGGPVAVKGPFTFSGNGSAVTFSPLTAITTGDPNQFFVTVGGVFQDPSTYTINQTGTSITFYSPPPTGTGNVVVSQVTGTLNNIYGASPFTPIAMTGLCLSTYWAFGSLSGVQGYPSDVCFHNDRLVLASSTLQPQSFWTSQVGDYLNFAVSDPQVASDAITETINARQQNPINNLITMNNLLLGTASASWRVTGSSNIGAISPNDIDALPQEFYGMAAVPAVQTGTTAIYVQWGGRKLRDIIYNFYNDKFQGQELTATARQMFPFGTTCIRAVFAPEPFGLIFCVRSDGVLCVCTYLPEQQVLAWSRWITAGTFEDVCVVPENNSFSVYVIVGRTINGAYQRYIERFAPREFLTVGDAFFVDSGLTYDGRNTGATTMQVTGGTTWQAQDTGTLTASAAQFVSSDPGLNNAVWLNDANGNRLCRLQITGYTSATVVSVKFLDPVPASVQGVAVTSWTFARTVFSGLTNLPGQTASIFADGGTMPQQTVSAAGTLTLPAAAGVVHAGLPYTCQVQSLALNIQGQPSIRNRKKTINRLSVILDQSGTFYAGPDFVNVVQAQIREFEPLGAPQALHTGLVNASLLTDLKDDAYICLQITDPVPLTVLGWLADISIGEAA